MLAGGLFFWRIANLYGGFFGGFFTLSLNFRMMLEEKIHEVVGD